MAACAPLPELISSYHFRPCGVASRRGIAADQLREKAHAVRVVCHHQEIQRSRKLGALPAGSDDLLALGETISVLRAEPRAERARVHRIRGVRVRVAEVRPRREIAPRVGRVRRLGGKRLLGRLLVERADVGGYVLCSDRRGEQARTRRRWLARPRRWRTDGSSSVPLGGLSDQTTPLHRNCESLHSTAIRSRVCRSPNTALGAQFFRPDVS